MPCRLTRNVLLQSCLYSSTTLLLLSPSANALTVSAGNISADSPPQLAQAIPDDTLGGEASRIVTIDASTERVEGGAIRNTHLFHSFNELNVGEGNSLYFANPNGILTILSRVTGNQDSSIFGTLGVEGPASLFLLNPNGILFGPDATLDIQGSFTATTADELTLVGSETFSATNPLVPTLLTISTPIGLQPGSLAQGTITNQGVLSTGEHLTLSGHQLYLEGQLEAGHNLTLQAQDTVTIRDTATDAFIATSGNNLLIQGNQGIDIWTLQHLDSTPFVSGGDLTLISDGDISADAHFESGGNLQFLTVAGQPGSFVSTYDPIIFANGDVVLGNYEGVALKIEATGSIQAGTIRILGPDTTFIADGSGSDEDLLASSSALIFRAGVQSISAASNLPVSTGGTTVANQAVDNVPPGSIIVTSINTSSVTEGGDGGPIILAADGNIVTNPNRERTGQPPFANLDTLSRTSRNNDNNGGNGGDITITSMAGNIELNGRLSAFSQALGNGSAGNGGNITISAEAGNIIINDIINAFSLSQQDTNGDASNGGTVSISSQSGDIFIKEKINSFSSAFDGNSGRGGDINISSTSGEIQIVEDLETFSESGNLGNAGNGGNIVIASDTGNITIRDEIETFTISREGIAGNGGNISISSSSGNILTEEEGFFRSFAFARRPTSERVGNGGKISLNSTSGNITTNGRLSSFSSTGSELLTGETGDGGDITISSVSGNITTNRIDTSSTFFAPLPNVRPDQAAPTGNGGDIRITSESGNITNNGFLSSSSISRSGDVGRGGDIFLSTKEGSIRNNPNELITTIAVSEVNGQTDTGGSVTLRANNISGARISTISSGNNPSGDINIQGNSDNVVIRDLTLVTSGELRVVNPAINTDEEVLESGQIIFLDASTFDRSGKTTINSTGNLILDNVEIRSNTNRSDNAGIVEISSNGSLEINNSKILSGANADSSGRGGDILIRNSNIALLRNSELATSSNGSGDAGNIQVENVDVLLLRQSSLLQAGASANGNGGNIGIDATVVIAVPDENNDILADTNSGVGGNIEINADTIIGFREVTTFSRDLRANSINDISARSERGDDGTVNLITPNLDPEQGLLELPANLADQSDLIAERCLADLGQDQSAFVFTGRGGVPLSPTEIIRSNAEGLVDLGGHSNTRDSNPGETATPETSDLLQRQSETSDSALPLLVEAQGWSVTETGLVQLLAQTSYGEVLSFPEDYRCSTS